MHFVVIAPNLAHMYIIPIQVNLAIVPSQGRFRLLPRGDSPESEKHASLENTLVGPVPARYVRQSQLCPQLDVSDKNDKKTQDMSDRARYVLHKM